jgi:hypothetical protein
VKELASRRSRLEARAIIMAIKRELAEFRTELKDELREERELERQEHLRQHHPEITRTFRPPRNIPTPFADVKVPYDIVIQIIERLETEHDADLRQLADEYGYPPLVIERELARARRRMEAEWQRKCRAAGMEN